MNTSKQNQSTFELSDEQLDGVHGGGVVIGTRQAIVNGSREAIVIGSREGIVIGSREAIVIGSRP